MAGVVMRIRCPECDVEMEIDRRSGRILHHGPALTETESSARFDQVMRHVSKSETEHTSAFDKAAAELQQRSKQLDSVFNDAVQKVHETDDGSKPFNPLDFE